MVEVPARNHELWLSLQPKLSVVDPPKNTNRLNLTKHWMEDVLPWSNWFHVVFPASKKSRRQDSVECTPWSFELMQSAWQLRKYHFLRTNTMVNLKMVIHKTSQNILPIQTRVQKLQIKNACKWLTKDCALNSMRCAPTWYQAKSERFLGRFSVQPDYAHDTGHIPLHCSLCFLFTMQNWICTRCVKCIRCRW